MTFQTAAPWAEQNFAACDLGDERLTKRLVGYATSAATAPSASIPKQCRLWKDSKGAYRLFDNDATTHEAVVQPHLQLTRAAAAECDVVLHISDTSTISYSGERDGLGPTSDGGQGMLLHSTLAVDVSGGIAAMPQVLGLTHQQVWSRTPELKKTPESAKWAEATAAIGPAPTKAKYIHVNDAEGDCFEALQAFREAAVGHVTRACQDRRITPGDNPQAEPSTSLFEIVRAQPALGSKTLWARARGNQEAGEIKLNVSAVQVTIHSPKNWSSKPHRKGVPRPEPIVCWAVRVWEPNPSPTRAGVEWILLTDTPVTDLASALLVTFWYSCRWLVEEYHKCLKTGCNIEGRQLESVERLEPLVGVLGVVAVRLLQLKHQARVNPKAPAASVVPMVYVRTLAARLKLKEKMTAREFWRHTAGMGGFLGRKGDGEPGWQTLWKGWYELELLTAGFEIGQRMKKRYG